MATSGPQPLSIAQVTRRAGLALAGITREYPHQPGGVLGSAASLRAPRAMHPAFYGCFDWHSAVHGHWTLVRLLKLFPAWKEQRREVVEAVGAHLSAANLAAEAAYFGEPENEGFERTYGWAWLLRLAQELRTWDHELGRRWAQHLRPLEDRIVALARSYLPRLHLPVRAGEHRDTAFALAFLLDYARAVGAVALEALCVERARTWYEHDVDYPLHYEPSGHDFFSAGLNEADLMRRVLPRPAYRPWLTRFLPRLLRGDLGPWAEPASVSDPRDGKLVHLVGLNLTRAWTLRGIAYALPADDPGRAYLDALVATHTRAGLSHVCCGHYAGEHWLGSFAVYLQTGAGV